MDLIFITLKMLDEDCDLSALIIINNKLLQILDED